MKNLYLLRHAHTIPAAPPLMGDFERILSPQGNAEALAIGRFMQAHNMYPDFVLSSSAIRTLQTARLVFGVLFSTASVRVESSFDRKLYQAPAEKILAEIQSMNDSVQSLMVVCHNPGVVQLAEALSNREFHNYQPGTLSVFTADCKSWLDFSPDTASFREIFIPNSLAA